MNGEIAANISTKFVPKKFPGKYWRQAPDPPICPDFQEEPAELKQELTIQGPSSSGPLTSTLNAGEHPL